MGSKYYDQQRHKPCDFSICESKNNGCGRCGFNPREAKRRKMLLRKNGLTKVGDTKRLIIGRKDNVK